MKLAKTVSIVTGGGQGIGQTIAHELAKEGSKVLVVDINLESASQVADEIKATGANAMALKTDVTKRNEVERMVTETVNNFKKIDILVNNAGISDPVPALQLTEDRWDRVIAINLKGPFICSQAVAKHMVQQKQGKIINIASVVANLAHPTQASYCASKAGLILLTKTLALEWGKYNINVNAVSPSTVETPVIKNFKAKSPEFLDGRLEATPFRRLIKPIEVANAVLFLASSDSDGITGANIIVDGGSSSIWAGAVPALGQI
jgi:NAD(P)-dependent dehydrogenase (short-subunit alcohol dehydrogenase family)